jgi:hypothetical protein
MKQDMRLQSSEDPQRNAGPMEEPISEWSRDAQLNGTYASRRLFSFSAGRLLYYENVFSDCEPDSDSLMCRTSPTICGSLA